MESDPQQERQQAHAYIDHLPTAQLAAVRVLLESMLDPVSRALANGPFDDEPISEEERDIGRSESVPQATPTRALACTLRSTVAESSPPERRGD